MATAPNSKKVSYEQWLRKPEVSDGFEEVVNGEIRIMPLTLWTHHQVAHNLRHQVEPQVDACVVMVIAEQFNLIVRRDPLTVRVPDFAVFEVATLVQKDDCVHSTPQLVVEISESNAGPEWEQKLADYASMGVPEAWVVSPETRTVEVLYLEEGKLRRAQVVAEGNLTPRRFPAINVEIAGIWPE